MLAAHELKTNTPCPRCDATCIAKNAQSGHWTPLFAASELDASSPEERRYYRARHTASLLSHTLLSSSPSLPCSTRNSMIETSTSKLSKDVEALSLSDYALSRSTTPQSSNCRPVPLSHRYGALVSQYDTIPASVVTLLEGAILYRTVRAFADCQSTFDLIDRDFRHHPIIAYEEYMAYWAQWRLLDCAKVIENALDRAHATGKDIQRFGLYTLLRIALGKAEVFTKGNFAKARDSMREVRRWLKDATVDQYTDVEVNSETDSLLCSKVKPDISSDCLFEPLLFSSHVCKPRNRKL